MVDLKRDKEPGEELPEFITQPTLCLCGEELNTAHATEPGVRNVAPGDVTICIYCTRPYVFRKDLSLEAVDYETLPQLVDKETMERVQEALNTLAKVHKDIEKS